MSLILPDSDDFRDTLDLAPMLLKAKSDTALVQDSETGLYREANAEEVFEYFHGGEYDETLERFSDDNVGINGDETTDEPLVIVPTAYNWN